MYDGAERQLEKGKDLFENVVSPLASLSDGWKHLGFKVFPEVENRKVFLNAGFSEEDVKVQKIIQWYFKDVFLYLDNSNKRRDGR